MAKSDPVPAPEPEPAPEQVAADPGPQDGNTEPAFPYEVTITVRAMAKADLVAELANIEEWLTTVRGDTSASTNSWGPELTTTACITFTRPPEE